MDQQGLRRTTIQVLCSIPSVNGKYQGLEPVSDVGGGGNFSVVFRGRASNGGRSVALKFELPGLDSYRHDAFDRECAVLSSLKGRKDALQLIAGIDQVVVPLEHVETKTTIPIPFRYFVMEAALSDFDTLLHTHNPSLSLLKSIVYFRAACRAVSRLHQHKICHRDLKPGNLLIFSGRKVKVGDFGTARVIMPGVPPLLPTYDFPRGDVRYTAPELLCIVENNPEAFFRADFYSLGAILFETVTGQVLSNLLFSLEDLHTLSGAFSQIPLGSRQEVFHELIPDVMRGRPLPSLREAFGEELGPAETRLESLYRNLAHFDPNKRLCVFDRVFSQLNVIISVLRRERDRKLLKLQEQTWSERRLERQRAIEAKFRAGQMEHV